MIYTKESLIERLKEIRDLGWILSERQGNAGGVGNTLEDLLDIEENNLPLPNAGEWELKCQRYDSGSLLTLFHMEPSPRALRFVPRLLLPNYGWAHQRIPNEISFRQTINGQGRTDRGFGIVVDREMQQVRVSFDFSAVDNRHRVWLNEVERRVGLGEINPQPYWGFNDLRNKAGTKLLNCFYVLARSENRGGREYLLYESITMLENFSFDAFLLAIEGGQVLIDFDARTNHNHGTKFRIRQDRFPDLYETAEFIE